MKWILVAAITLAVSSCQTTSEWNPGVSIGVTYATGKLVQKSPDLLDELIRLADGFEDIADGVVNQETILNLLEAKLPDNTPEAKALRSLIASYFPSDDAALPLSDRLRFLCQQIAAAIRFGLPASK